MYLKCLYFVTSDQVHLLLCKLLNDFCHWLKVEIRRKGGDRVPLVSALARSGLASVDFGKGVRRC